MSDAFYNALWCAGYPAFWTTSRPTVLNADVTRRPGPYLLASTHESPYDVPLLMRHVARNIDFVSITEVFQNPLVAWLYGSMNAFPLDRSRPDAKTIRVILDRLERGRVVGMLPEGRMQRGEKSVIHTRRIRPGIGRLARLAGVPIIPVAIVNSPAYGRATSWLPLRRIRYGVAFGEPIAPGGEPSEIEAHVVDAMVDLHRRLVVKMKR